MLNHNLIRWDAIGDVVHTEQRKPTNFITDEDGGGLARNYEFLCTVNDQNETVKVRLANRLVTQHTAVHNGGGEVVNTISSGNPLH
jgi:hypothetical protein